MAKAQRDCNLDDPREMFAWMFSAGVPDPRGDGKFPNQPMIPPTCYEALSEQLYKMGARFHPELQELWVKDQVGPEQNFVARGVTDIKPEDIEGDVAAMVADQFPEVAARVAGATDVDEALAEQTQVLLKNLADLKAARARLGA